MGLSKDNQKQLILDILKAHQTDQVTRRGELEQLSRLTSSLQAHAMTEKETQVLNALQAYCKQESLHADGASLTSLQEINSLVQNVKLS